jgi:hypothetical protein
MIYSKAMLTSALDYLSYCAPECIHPNSTAHTAQHSTLQHSTAHYSTAQHSTAHYITLQHSTAQHSTVLHCAESHLQFLLLSATGSNSTVLYRTIRYVKFTSIVLHYMVFFPLILRHFTLPHSIPHNITHCTIPCHDVLYRTAL